MIDTRKCELCGSATTLWTGRCTNGRCEDCHRKFCGPGGDTSPGHARNWPKAHAERGAGK